MSWNASANSSAAGSHKMHESREIWLTLDLSADAHREEVPKSNARPDPIFLSSKLLLPPSLYEQCVLLPCVCWSVFECAVGVKKGKAKGTSLEANDDGRLLSNPAEPSRRLADELGRVCLASSERAPAAATVHHRFRPCTNIILLKCHTACCSRVPRSWSSDGMFASDSNIRHVPYVTRLYGTQM